MNKIFKKELILFIVNMQQAGVVLPIALENFKKELTNPKEQKVIEDIIVDFKKGMNQEDVLLNHNVIDNFEYSILSVSNSKKNALKKIAETNDKNYEITKFYLTKWFWLFMIPAIIFIALPTTIDFGTNLMSQVAMMDESKKFSDFPALIISLRDYYYIFAAISIIGFISIVYFYFYTYKTNLELHYKIFKYRALNDGVYYLNNVQNMLSSGLTLVNAIKILEKQSMPISSRKIFSDIKKDIEHDKPFGDNFKRLGVNSHSVFVLNIAKNSNNIKRGIKNGYLSAVEYKETHEEKYKQVLELIVFAVNSLLVSIFLFFVMLMQIDATM